MSPGQSRAMRSALLIGSLVFGALLRLQSARTTTGLSGFWTGEWDYYGIATQVADAGRYKAYPDYPPTAFRMPLYPTFLAALRKLSPGMPAVRFTQAALDTAALAQACLLAGLLGGPWAAALTAALGALAAVPLGQLALPQVETFYGWLVMNSVCALVLWSRESGSRRRAALAGTAVGLTLLCRTVFILLPPLVVIGFFLTEGWRKRAAAAAVFLACAYLPLLPWAVRNQVVFRRAVVAEDGAAALNLWGASVGRLESPTVAGLAADGKHAAFLLELQNLPDAQRSRRLVGSAFANIRRSPFVFLKTALLRLPVLWAEQGWLWAAAAGLILLAPWQPPLAIALGCALYFDIYALMGVQVRYARPAFGLMCVLAALGLLAVRRRMRNCAPPEDAAPERLLSASVAGITACAGLLALLATAVVIRDAAQGATDDVPAAFRGEPQRYARLKRLQGTGIDLILTDRLLEGRRSFSLILDEDPCFGEALLSRAMVFEWMGDRTRAAGDYRRATACLEGGGTPSRLAGF